MIGRWSLVVMIPTIAAVLGNETRADSLPFFSRDKVQIRLRFEGLENILSSSFRLSIVHAMGASHIFGK